MCAGSEFHMDGAESEIAREVKLLVMPEGLARRCVLEECKALEIGEVRRMGGVECFPR